MPAARQRALRPRPLWLDKTQRVTPPRIPRSATEGISVALLNWIPRRSSRHSSSHRPATSTTLPQTKTAAARCGTWSAWEPLVRASVLLTRSTTSRTWHEALQGAAGDGQRHLSVPPAPPGGKATRARTGHRPPRPGAATDAEAIDVGLRNSIKAAANRWRSGVIFYRCSWRLRATPRMPRVPRPDVGAGWRASTRKTSPASCRATRHRAFQAASATHVGAARSGPLNIHTLDLAPPHPACRASQACALLKCQPGGLPDGCWIHLRRPGFIGRAHLNAPPGLELPVPHRMPCSSGRPPWSASAPLWPRRAAACDSGGSRPGPARPKSDGNCRRLRTLLAQLKELKPGDQHQSPSGRRRRKASGILASHLLARAVSDDRPSGRRHMATAACQNRTRTAGRG